MAKNMEPVYEETKERVYEILWEYFFFNVTIGELKAMYLEKFNTPMPLCGYPSDVELLKSMTEEIQVLIEPLKPTMVCALMPKAAILKARDGVHRPLKYAFLNVSPGTLTIPDDEYPIKMVKEQFRNILYKSDEGFMKKQEFFALHQRQHGTVLPCSPEELFNKIGDVIVVEEGTDIVTLSPPEMEEFFAAKQLWASK